MTIYFWVQVMRVEELPPAVRPVAASISGAEAKSVILLAKELLIDNRRPLPYLSGRDPFFVEIPESQSQEAQIKPHEKFILSSVIYNDKHALAVINGEILAEGDTIYDIESGYQYLVENIEVDKVEVSDGEGNYTLNMISKIK
jgi:hypothetical protein